jgi:hypothetical protein
MEQIIPLITAAILLGLIALLIYVTKVFWMAWQRNKALLRQGADTQAEVIGREVKNNWWASAEYIITYRYLVPTPEGEKAFTATERVWLTEYDHYQVGTKLSVRYLPSNPTNALRSTKVVGRR